MHELVDAMDSKGKWYKGFIAEEKEDWWGEISRKVHFFNFDPRWDEWYSNENIEKLAPYLTYCQEAGELYYSIEVYNINEDRGGAFFGMPLIVTLLSELTW